MRAVRTVIGGKDLGLVVDMTVIQVWLFVCCQEDSWWQGIENVGLRKQCF